MVVPVKNPHLAQLRSLVAKAPASPGVYRWLNAKGEVLYVGKAKSLRSRLKSYVLPAKGDSLGPWKQSLVAKIADVEVTVTRTELEALVLETNLIKELKPKYNVLMKDDKNYVYVRIAVQDPFPGVEVVRRLEQDGAKYFGPYLSAFSVRRLLEALHLAFPYRTSAQTIEKLNRIARNGEDADMPIYRVPPLECQIGKHCGLGTGNYTRSQYLQAIEQLLRFFRGDHDAARRKLTEEMQRAALDRKFEKAAQLRDTLQYVRELEERQIVSDTSGMNTDFIGTALLRDRVQVVLLRERGGKLVGEHSFALAGHADAPSAAITQFLPQYYSSTPDFPDTVVVDEAPEGRKLLEEWLSERRGKRVTIAVPERGKKVQLLLMAQENARQKVAQQLARWEAAQQDAEETLRSLQETLGLSALPKRIEGYDISHLSGTETVGSMAVLKNGKTANDQYRSFTIRTLADGEVDDYAALREVLKRRLLHLVRDVKQEEKQWNARGIKFGKARKAEQKSIEETVAKHPDDLDPAGISYRDFLVARKGEELVAFVRSSTHKGGVTELKTLWVEDAYRGDRLGQFLLRKLLARLKEEKVYVTTEPKLQEYYGEVGFRHVITPPKALADVITTAQKLDPKFADTMVMVYITSEHKPDASLQSHPDLLVIDGGKGQLSAVARILASLHREIPLISLAKREEEVFVLGSKVPAVFSPDSPAKFLLMRLRDEAHRFANRHREARGKKHAV
ncbi:MAG: excinuclease ABC subunit UvrC, partial [Candidatus Peribacteraceae bacterium]|nr:excinuclease ABC subunit UvrC [Candidatus Peribacteraceae bacterium]